MGVALVVIGVVVGVHMFLGASLHRSRKRQGIGKMAMAPLVGVAVHQRSVAMFEQLSHLETSSRSRFALARGASLTEQGSGGSLEDFPPGADLLVLLVEVFNHLAYPLAGDLDAM